MLIPQIEQISTPEATRYQLFDAGCALSYSDVLKLWKNDAAFCREFSQLLGDSSYTAFRWETPPVTRQNLVRPFEFVLVSAPRLDRRRTDLRTYAAYFSEDETQAVVAFPNLSGDATLVVPAPMADPQGYLHLAAFLRNAPEGQQRELWKTVANELEARLSKVPCWLNTAGGGVAYLHVRIDSSPKYYAYRHYASPQA